ncbi:hypothetical protein [Neobacillus ginsengisoli]|uniref:YozE SAM-like domain-containing protein n=1 Tax=Neobacillus ginsengisoli TaxID=904295 RepID=A0ABT9XNF6_9BACI|nr:hypothetical protein [Neobacillus ginsengisoli]MDQ0197074.1 hypothetical protein [Neobacillus ginsengisoli]
MKSKVFENDEEMFIEEEEFFGGDEDKEFEEIFQKWKDLGKVPENEDDKDDAYYTAFCEFIIEYGKQFN